MSHPFEGWSAINEAWDTGGSVETSELLNNVKTVGGNFLGPVAFVFVGIWALKVLLSIAVAVLVIVAQAAGIEVLYKFSNLLGYLSIPILALVGLASVSLFRPIQVQAFEGRDFVGSIGDALRLAREAMGKTAVTTLLWGATMCVGAIGCGIGALIPLFFFSQSPYLAATTELGPWECMRRSYELNKAYWMPALGVVVGSLATVVVLQGCGGVVVSGFGGILTKVNVGFGMLVMGLGHDLIGMIVGAMILVVSGAIFTTIQSVERGRPLHD